MTDEFFRSQLIRVSEQFGAKAITAERSRMIWHVTKDLHEGAFMRIVDHFLASFRYAPLPKDFIEAALRERAGMSQARFQEQSSSREPQCNKCCDAGVFEVSHDMSGKIVFVRCSCDAGKDYYQCDIPQWNAFKIGNEFTPLYMGDNQRYLIWKPDGGWKPGQGMSQLNEKTLMWKSKMKESREFWRTFGLPMNAPPPEPA
jgi:hypothetical protein